LIIDRDQLTTDRDAARARAAGAENQIVDMQAQLSDTKLNVTQLGEQLTASTSEVTRLQQEASVLRDRIQAVQSETRDQVRAADAATAAQRKSAQIATAMGDLEVASNNLSKTRESMISVLLDQVSAERGGRVTQANSLVAQYNTLLTTHNRQVGEFNAALGKVRGLLA
jgi:chromosome segregation ATPase